MALKFGKYLLLAALMPLIALPAKAQWAAQATSLTPLVSSLVVGVREPAAAPAPAKQIFFIPQAVFYSYRHGAGELYGMNLDGSVQLRLTKNTISDTQPSLSLDGSKVVFIRYVNQYGNVFIMNADGTEQTQLTNNTSGTGDYTPAISPDKSKIVFQRNFNEIYIMNADGSNQRRLTNNDEWDGWPTFSPDGSKILFTRESKICIMNLNGTNVTNITNNNTWSDGNAKFSPDGQRIVFMSSRDVVNNDRNYNIYIMRPDGTGQTRIVSNVNEDIYPRFSRDGSRIYFESNRDGSWQIYSTPINGFFQTRITDLETDGINGFNS